MKKSNLFFIGALGIILLIAIVSTSYFVYRSKHAVLNETVALFSNQGEEESYLDLLGNEVLLEQYLGRVLVVVSWASWSPFSQNDLLMLKELSSKYDQEQVVFLAINRKETKEQAARYLNTLPALDRLIVVLDPRDFFYGTVGGYAMPEALIYNNRGEVVEHFRGIAPKVDIENVLNNLINPE